MTQPPSSTETPTPPRTTLPPAGDTKSQQRALTILAAFSCLVVLRIAQPVGIGLLLGTLSAFAIQPFYQRLCRRMPRAPGPAALACVLLTALVLAGAIGGFGYLVVVRGLATAKTLMAALAPGGSGREIAARYAHLLGPFQLRADEIAAKVRDAAAELAGRAAEVAAAVASATFSMLLVLFFLVLTMYYVLRNWSSLAGRAEGVFPLNPRHTRALFEEFRLVGRNVLLGTVVTGAAQGLLAGLGYAMFGVTEAAFFGAATAVASLVPAVGTLMVWVPIGLYLLATGHPGAAVGVLVWGALVVVGVSDYVIRPRLVGGHANTPALITFIALFGGVEAFGLIGLIVGPVLMTLALAVLRLYAQERAAMAAAAVAREDG